MTKRIIAGLLVLILSFSTFQMSVAAAGMEGELDSEEDLITELEPIVPTKMEDKTPCYGDYEIIVNEDEYSTMAADAKDEYESNNSFSAATMMNSQPTGTPQNISKSINATLHRETWVFGLIERDVDEDYYRFDLFGKAEVTISLTNIPEDCDYDIRLYTHDNIRYAEDEDITLVGSSVNLNNSSETITRTLSPGTYYLWIYSHNDVCDDSSYYTLSLNATYTAKDEQISALKYNKGAKAALWVSDYDPCGIIPFSSIDKEEIGYISSSSNIARSCFQNPFTKYFDTSNIEQAVLYIWDSEIRMELREVLAEMYVEVNASLQDDIEYLMVWEKVEADVDGVSTVAGVLLSFYTGESWIAKVADKFFSVAPTVVSIAKGIFAPTEEAIVTKENLLNYITILRTALEASSQTGNEVVRIPYAYSYYQYNSTGIDVMHISYFLDYTPVLPENFLYNSDTIYSWSASSIVRGTIYGIVDEDDFEKAISHGSTYLPDVNTSVVRTLGVDSSMAGTIHRGEYHWYAFTAPSAGTYAFYTENSYDEELDSFDTYGELFSSVVPARSTTWRLASNDDGGDGYEFRIEYTLSAGQTVYLRVRGVAWSTTGTYVLRATKIS